jgi:hypothetical protein
MIYSNLKELGDNTLQANDSVYFYINDQQLKYSVIYNHLSNDFKCNNSEIFSILDIDRHAFCDYHYGYHNQGGDWPTCKPEDFAALTRVVKALYQEIESKKIKEIAIHSDGNPLIQELKTSLSSILPNKLLITPLILEKKEDTSSNILVKRKSKVKRIIGEESIKLNNY